VRAAEIISQLEKHYLNLSNQVEVIDIATPTTMKRYTKNWQGSIQA
jgi:hypothetical protein